jgi:DNA-binding transcriptional LysR family regulator
MRLNLSSGFSCDLVHDVLTGELDIALVIEPPDSAMLTGLKIDESPFYVVMPQEDELSNYPSLSLDQLAGKRWVLFQRQTHPPLYDLIRKRAQDLQVIPSALQHFIVPEEAVPLLREPGGIVIVAKSSALRIARTGLTMRPLDEATLNLGTLLISRADNDSRVVSELVRNFMRRMNHLNIDDPMSLPIPV